MGKQIFATLVKNDHKFGQSDYILGRISGFLTMLCDESLMKGFANIHRKDGVVLRTECTADQYNEFAQAMERMYPGLCSFNI